MQLEKVIKCYQSWAIYSIQSIMSGDVEQVKRELRKGVDINSKDSESKTALHFAAEFGKLNS